MRQGGMLRADRRGLELVSVLMRAATHASSTDGVGFIDVSASQHAARWLFRAGPKNPWKPQAGTNQGRHSGTIGVAHLPFRAAVFHIRHGELV